MYRHVRADRVSSMSTSRYLSRMCLAKPGHVVGRPPVHRSPRPIIRPDSRAAISIGNTALQECADWHPEAMVRSAANELPPNEIARLAHAAASSRLATFATTSGASMRQGEGWFAVRTGMSSNDMNGIISEPGAAVSRRLVEDLVSWFEGVPASWMTSRPDARLTALLIDAGARSERTGSWSGMRISAQLPVPYSGTTIRVTRSADDVEMWLDVAAECGWIVSDADRRARRTAFLSLLGRGGPLTQWLATDETGPVGFASSYLHRAVVDLCDLGVLPTRRREGIGQGLVCARLAAAFEQGATTTVSAPSPHGWALQRTLGFISVPVVSDTTFYLPV